MADVVVRQPQNHRPSRLGGLRGSRRSTRLGGRGGALLEIDVGDRSEESFPSGCVKTTWLPLTFQGPWSRPVRRSW
jgi:hypothetical protein